MDLMSLVARLSLDTSDYDKGINNAKGALPSLSAGAVAVGNLISGTFQAAGGKLKEFGGYIAGAGMSFESTMSEVSAISGATGKDFNDLTNKAKEMGQKTKFSATEAGEAFTYMAMAGWKTDDMLRGIDGIMNLAAASGENLALTSDIVTDALTAFGLGADKAGDFADIMAAASSNANTNVSLLGETFKYVAPVAGALGYKAEDTAVAIGLMANAGIKGSQAGTALRGMFSRLAKPSKETAQAMKKLGISMTDSSGKVKPLNDLLEQMRKKFSKLSEAEQAQYAASIAGQEGMSGLLAIVNASKKDFDDLTAAVNHSKGASEKMADTMNQNLAGKITILKSGVESLALAFYDGFKGTAQTAVEGITTSVEKMTNKVNSWVNSAPVQEKLGKIAEAVQRIIEKLNDGLEPALNVVIAVFDKVVTAIEFVVDNFDAIAAAVGSAVAAFATFQAVSKAMNFAKLLTSPLGLVSVAIFGVVTALKNAGVTMNDVKAVFQKGIDKIKKAWAKISPPIEKAVRLIKGVFAPLANYITNVMNGAVTGVQLSFEGLVKGFQLVWENIKKVFAPIAQSFLKWFQDIDGAAIGEMLSQKFTEIVDKVKGIFSTIGEWIVTVFNMVDWEAVGNIFATFASTAWQIITDTFSVVGDKLYEWFTSVDWQGVIDTVGGWASSAWDIISCALSVVAGKLYEWFTAVDWESVKETVGGWASFAWEKIKEALSIAAGKLYEWFTSVDWESVKETVGGWASTAWEKIQTALSVVAQNLYNWFTNVDWEDVKEKVGGWASTAWENIKTALSNVAQNLYTWFTNVDWEDVKGKVGGWASGAWEKIKTALSETASKLYKWFTNVDWAKVKKKVGGWADGAWKKIKQALSDTASKLFEWFTNVDWEEVKKKVSGWAEGAFKAVKGFLEGTANKIADWYTNTDWEDVKEKTSSWTKGTLEKIGNGLKSAANFIKGLFTGDGEGATKVDWNSIAEKITPWVNGALTIIDSTLGGVADGLIQYFTNGKESWDSVKDKVTSWTSGAWENIRSTFSGFGSKFVSWITNFKFSDILDKFANLGQEIFNTITGKLKNIGNAIGNFFTGGNNKDAGNKAKEAAKEAAYNISSGFTGGIHSNATSFFSAGSDMVVQTLKGTKETAKIGSPSKLFADEVGRFIPLGVAEGINKYSGVAEKAAEDMISVPEVRTGGLFGNSGFGRDAVGLGNGMTVNLTINGAQYSNEQSLAEAISNELQYMLERRRAVFA